jgi:hypothetical protein
MLSHAEIFQKIDSLTALHRGPTKHCDISEVTGDLARFLHQNRDGIDVDRLARSYVAAYDRGRRPKFDSKQISFFEPDAWIPAGRNQRIEMRFATLADLLEWESIEVAEHVPSAVAHNRKIAYIRSRSAIWDTSKYRTLGDLEGAEFAGGGHGTTAK